MDKGRHGRVYLIDVQLEGAIISKVQYAAVTGWTTQVTLVPVSLVLHNGAGQSLEQSYSYLSSNLIANLKPHI